MLLQQLKLVHMPNKKLTGVVAQMLHYIQIVWHDSGVEKCGIRKRKFTLL
jgi:hypothetical protein